MAVGGFPENGLQWQRAAVEISDRPMEIIFHLQPARIAMSQASLEETVILSETTPDMRTGTRIRIREESTPQRNT